MFRNHEPMDASTWMSNLDDDIPVAGLTIPGTHDSAAYSYSFPFVATQKLDIYEQLGAGIRYFDFRCGVREDIVEMVHGPTYLGLTLQSLLQTIYGWLEKHPTEGLLIQLKQDRTSENSKVAFDSAVFDLIVRNAEFWRTASTQCSLGILRGRIQLFRRFLGPTTGEFGIDVTKWQDNPSTPFTILAENRVQLTIQDHYSFPQGTDLPGLIRRKGGDVRELLQRAENDGDLNHWYINFTSAYELNMRYQINPHQVAVGSYWGFHWEEGMNLRLRSFLREGPRKEKKRFGIIAMDFPEQGAADLVPALISTNFYPRKRSLRYRPPFFLIWLALLISLFLALWSSCNTQSTIDVLSNELGPLMPEIALFTQLLQKLSFIYDHLECRARE